MARLKLLRTDSGRRLFVADPWLDLRSTDLAGVRWPACLLASDHAIDAESVRPALSELLCCGATYFCFVGPNATELHALVDGLDISLTQSLQIPGGRGTIAMTTGENDSTLEETVFHFAACAFHADHDAFDRILLPLGLGGFKESILERLRVSADF